MIDDHQLAANVARDAGELLLALRAEMAGAPAERLRAEGDRRSHLFVTAALAAARPGDALLSEEATADPARLSASRVWIVDPLDGTREYSEPGRCDWAVHVALVVDGMPSCGAVALPALHSTLATCPAPTVMPRRPGPIRIAVSRTRPPAVAQVLRRALGARLVPMGSAGAKAMAVVAGAADVYVHAGGQYEWDSAAPAAVADAAGLHASRLDGSPLVYNRPGAWLPDFLVCRPELADLTLSVLAGAACAGDAEGVQAEPAQGGAMDSQRHGPRQWAEDRRR